MNPLPRQRPVRTAARWLAGGAALAAVSYLGYAAGAWFRYGHAPGPASAGDAEPLLDSFMPRYDVVERHHVQVGAPADVTFAAAREMDLLESPVARAIFKGRELVLGSEPEDELRPRALVDAVQALGWGLLADVPGREIVFGAVTKPWEGEVVFHAIAPPLFAGFDEPGYVKIVWNLRADPLSGAESVFRTETRAIATDAFARAKFRCYWSWASPGIWLIRRVSLGPLKADAERRARESGRKVPAA